MTDLMLALSQTKLNSFFPNWTRGSSSSYLHIVIFSRGSTVNFQSIYTRGKSLEVRLWAKSRTHSLWRVLADLRADLRANLRDDIKLYPIISSERAELSQPCPIVT